MLFLTTSDGTNVPATEIIVLDVWDKLGIIACAALFLAIVLICLVCALSPDCCLYNYCPFQYEQVPVKGKNNHKYGSVLPSPPPYDSKDKFPPPVFKQLGAVREFESSEYSDSSGTNVIELKKSKYKSDSRKSSLNGSIYSSGKMERETPILDNGVIEYSLKYDKFEGKLNINILQVKDLCVTDLAAIISPYARVRLFRAPRQIFNLGKEHVINNLDMELRTKMQKSSVNPVFNELFTVSIEPNELRHYTMKLQLCDLDKFSRHVVLGETTVGLKKLELTDFSENHFSQPLHHPEEEEAGDIYLSLTYLPTAEKLYLTVIKIKGLKAMNKQQNTTDAYVKIALMHEGRHLKKSKTIIKKGELNPDFDETFAFDVPNKELARVYFRVTVLHANKELHDHRLIGRIYLGLNFDVNAHAHWSEMMQHPRKQIMCWHKIRC
ncbi:hypothetical protein KUTeg_002119 [Tegillarca granosa]|uniref:C2 domain-containing protein n=1 Tax=Tegillarca granosa TaxID=220873 RepID=A0ABQ9FX13_TEGGR|nr:hypothetical protein KUTeg_002119 [Tegillarca granosa]